MAHIHHIPFVIAMLSLVQLHAQLELNCENDSSGLIPLTDLGAAETYETYTGGLYPGGNNLRPYFHEQQGKKISKQVKPLNVDGVIDWTEGEILFIGMGGSNGANTFNTYIDTMNEYDWTGTNPCLRIKGLFFGGKDLGDMTDTTIDYYWVKFQERLIVRGDSWEEIQIVWMLEHSENDTMDIDYFINYSVEQYITLFQRMNDSMPNLKQVYLTGFHYTGYTHPSHDLYYALAEPKGYWGNIAIKEVIERQINGDPELMFTGPNKKAPYISWGPYFWADGNNPRGTDSLTWPCEDYRDDDTGGGFHLEPSGEWKEAQMLMDFFETDPVASVWYNDALKWAPCIDPERYGAHNTGDENNMMIYPNPAVENITIELPADASGRFQCKIYNNTGQLVLSEKADMTISLVFQLNVNRLTNGIYTILLSSDNNIWVENFVVQK